MKEIKCPKCGEVFKIDEESYDSIVKQVRDKEFKDELKSRENQLEAEKNNALQLVKLELEREFDKKINEKDTEITKLKSDVEQERFISKTAITELSVNKDREIAELKNKLSAFDKDKELELNKLKTEKILSDKEFQLKEQSIKEQYEAKIKFMQEEIERYKDFKARLSTKMIGESLEQHCETEFNKIRPTGFKNAYFEKDNDAKTGSKGDYIFREFDEEGQEFVSIMFEMKNEADTTSTKKKNEDFLKELDKDRSEKHCEYAILVSMLEPESELYNTGIVDVSHKYPKMYVIRPQFFIPVITMLRNTALNSLEYRKELVRVKTQNIDISNFEDQLNEFKDKFSKVYINASNRYDDAIAEIDKSIDHLQKTKKALQLWLEHLRSANNKAEDLSIKRLTKNNPTMQAKFEALKGQNDPENSIKQIAEKQ